MNVRMAAIPVVAVGLMAAALGGVAEARNANCSGGILYVSQAIGAREKQDMAESHKLMLKAVDKLSQCATEDPTDFEALGYLGWAYAEIDSFRPAGVYFQKSIDGLGAKGDKKKVEWASDNRKSFVVRELNAGIGQIRESQSKYPDLSVAPTDDAQKTLAAESRKNIAEAVRHLNNALVLVPATDTLASSVLKNLGFAYMMTGDDSLALKVYNDAVQKSPNDKDLQQARRALLNDLAMKKLAKGDYGTSVATLEALAKEDPTTPSRFGGLGDAYFERAQNAQPDSAGRGDYVRAAEAYAKASDLAPKEHTYAYNAGLAYYNARLYPQSEPMFRRAAEDAPDDAQTVAYWGASLAAAKKFDESAKVFSKLLADKPKDKTARRMLVIAYNFAGMGSKASEQYLVRKALEDGKPAADVAAAAAGSAQQAKIKEANGAPEEIYQWELKASDQAQKVDTWFYWSKKKAFHFANGQLLGQTDWSTIDFKGGSK